MNRTNSFFHHPEAILMEIALDATMAGATTLEMNLRGAFLDIHDDRPLKTDDDAWFHSFLQLMVASETITFTDRLGTVTVDCARYFSDEEYRARVFRQLVAGMLRGRSTAKINEPRFAFADKGLLRVCS